VTTAFPVKAGASTMLISLNVTRRPSGDALIHARVRRHTRVQRCRDKRPFLMTYSFLRKFWGRAVAINVLDIAVTYEILPKGSAYMVENHLEGG
jgi:hypothetical protein